MFFEPEYWLVVAMFATFIALIFSGFPVAWVLAGVGILYAGTRQYPSHREASKN